jgi:hypothetical protein
MPDLETSFQKVCDLWLREKVPGILAAWVSRDDSQPHMVHDIRVFANHAAYQAHTDRSDPALVAAMEDRRALHAKRLRQGRRRPHIFHQGPPSDRWLLRL